jgi:hypothetical protein
MARPPISKAAAAIVWFRAKGHCEGCGVRLPAGSPIDHWPPLGLRERDYSKKDTDPTAYRPHANDTTNLQLFCEACHKTKTFGDSLHRGDVQNIARSKRIAKDTEEFQRRILAKSGQGEAGVGGAGSAGEVVGARPLPKLQGRGFPKSEKNPIKSRGFAGSRKFNGDVKWNKKPDEGGDSE